jgi:hypothetical protein
LLTCGVESSVFKFGFQKHNDKINITIILPVVLCEFETWSLILREKRRLRVFENRVLRRIFGTNRDEITGEWRKLKRRLMICTHHKYRSSDQTEKNDMGGACSTYGGEERCIQGCDGET